MTALPEYLRQGAVVRVNKEGSDNDGKLARIDSAEPTRNGFLRVIVIGSYTAPRSSWVTRTYHPTQLTRP